MRYSEAQHHATTAHLITACRSPRSHAAAATAAAADGGRRLSISYESERRRSSFARIAEHAGESVPRYRERRAAPTANYTADRCTSSDRKLECAQPPPSPTCKTDKTTLNPSSTRPACTAASGICAPTRTA